MIIDRATGESHHAMSEYAYGRQIMGKRFFGVDEVEGLVGACYLPSQRSRLAILPFPPDALEGRRDTHALIATPPMSLRDLADRVGRRLFARTVASYEGTDLSDSAADASWHCLRLGPLRGTENKSWREQIRVLPAGERAASARALACAFLYLAFGEWDPPDIFLRCSDCLPDDRRVMVGLSACGGLVHIGWGGFRHPRIGLATELAPRQ